MNSVSLVLNQLMPLLLSVLVPGAISYAAVLYKHLVERLPSKMQDHIHRLAGQAVQAVEQSMQGASGQAKKAAAEHYINDILAGLHLSISAQLVDSAIESAVYELNQYKSVMAVDHSIEKAAALPPVVSEQAAK